MKLTKALLSENSFSDIKISKGEKEARKLVDYLRLKVYKGLSDDDMDDFVIYMANHLDLEVPKYRLKESDFGGYTKFKPESEKLEAELRDTYNREDIFVTIGQYHERDRGFGKVTIRTEEEVPAAEYKNIKNTLSAKGYEITGGMNFGEREDDRITYPTVKFEFDIKG
tara:strand:+ start:252 stop:755 length:504 start_codon:yes stop_codon:yes gene_type:complete